MFSILKFFLVVFLITVNTPKNDFPKLTGPYLGQNLPGENPVKYSFDFMPEGYRLHSAPAFMPRGKEVYFSARDFKVRFSEKIFVMKISNEVWEQPKVVSFSGNFFDGSPSISGDGKYLFFSSARTTDQKGRNEKGVRNIWFVERNCDEWESIFKLHDKTQKLDPKMKYAEPLRKYLRLDQENVYADED